MRPDIEFAERFMRPATRRLFHRWGWVSQIAASAFFLAFGVGAFFELLPVDMVAAVLVPLFSWVTTWLTFTQAMRTRARRSIDYPNDM
jgi:hypothetical protein